MRLLHMLKVDARWHVAKPQPAVFEITKTKFHNVLQGVPGEAARLTLEDAKLYEEWIKENVQRYWGHEKGPIAKSDIV
jgi:hypothetical protein